MARHYFAANRKLSRSLAAPRRVLARRSNSRGVLVVAVMAALLVPAVAQAQVQEAARARIKMLNTRAMDDYDGLEFDAAKKKLLEALSVARQASVSRGSELARTNINLGVVMGAGFNDRIAAVKHFTEGLRLDRSLKLDAARATPALEEMFKSASDSVGPAQTTDSSFEHEPVDEATGGQSVRLRAIVGGGLGAARCVAYYRVRGSRAFERVVLKKYRGGVFSGVIPGENVRPPSIYYYVEAQDGSGERLAGRGQRTSPLIISVEKGSGTPPKDDPKTPSGPKIISLGVMAGFGAGIVFGGTSELQHARVASSPETVDIKPGGAVAPFHLALEFAYHLNEDWHLALLGRLQVVTALSGQTISNANPISMLGIARAKRFFGEGKTRFYLSFGAGGGNIRHRIPLGDYDPNEDQTGRTPNNIVDARVAGVGAFGFGGGMTAMLTDIFGFIIDASGLILVPNFSAHLDINLGFLFSF